MNGKILFVVRGIFPKGAAYASRAVNFARMFYHIGYDVHIISDYTLEEFNLPNEISQFEDCTYQSVTRKPSFLKNFIIGKKSINLIREYLNDNKVDYIITSASYDRFEELFKICRKKKYPLILEICEWYDISSFRFGYFNPLYRKFLKCINGKFEKADAVIPISRLLEKRFKLCNKLTLRIPTILNVLERSFTEETHNAKVKIIFAGSPGPSKEKFENILEALNMLGEEKRKFEFRIFGFSEKLFLAKLGKKQALYENVKDSVSILGKIPQDQVHQEYLSSDFSIFIRPDRRSSHAGFPTKLAESMVAGTPVISNDTGDIGLYLNDNANGFLLQNDCPKTISKIFRKILTMDNESRIEMRRQARKKAEECFDYRLYENDMRELLKKARGD